MPQPLEYLLRISRVPGSCQILGRAGVEQDYTVYAFIKLLYFSERKGLPGKFSKTATHFSCP